jgi:hypothetical protein
VHQTKPCDVSGTQDRVKAEFERLDFTSTIARLQGLAKQWKAQDKALETLKVRCSWPWVAARPTVQNHHPSSLQAALGGDDGELSLIVQERVQLQHQAYVACIPDGRCVARLTPRGPATTDRCIVPCRIECLDCLKAMAKNRTKLLRAAPPVRTDTYAHAPASHSIPIPPSSLASVPCAQAPTHRADHVPSGQHAACRHRPFRRPPRL